jgi:CheY-like chemotaxis protein
VNGDVGRLQQVIANLLSNACKFTPAGGQITVSLDQAGGQIELQVADSGEGIDPAFLPFVFDRFRQADNSATRHHGGLGLGLAIARHLVELHGGTISVCSDGQGHGACFTVRLPAKPGVPAGAAAQDPAPSPEEPDFSNVRMLVVDDDPDSGELLQRLLSDCRASVTVAHSVNEALATLRKAGFSLLLSDIGMPGRDGYDLIRDIRGADAEWRNIRAIAITAFARQEDRQYALQAGYDEYLTKPINTQQLFKTISRVLEVRTNRSRA